MWGLRRPEGETHCARRFTRYAYRGSIRTFVMEVRILLAPRVNPSTRIVAVLIHSQLLQERMPPRAGRMLSSASVVSAILFLHATALPTAEADWGFGWINNRLQKSLVGPNKSPCYLGRLAYNHPDVEEDGNEGNEGENDKHGNGSSAGKGHNEGEGLELCSGSWPWAWHCVPFITSDYE